MPLLQIIAKSNYIPPPGLSPQDHPLSPIHFVIYKYKYMSFVKTIIKNILVKN